ncbi:hypothetical protein DLAC_00316 [Tieghemostelium lacteum]|uniref:Uncharacterized protein n=1 Tax=Tieghemostelium lacteum TaxID=361077 RepID=A0A152A9E9_TIELA|nr:hypothetical protein DLAC_00316 [Tieghemostelium lacteum]|eukprot:KYR02848.1 hypothetical protein DLAC_00316 [Tieghemostelium lacteum]
MGDDGDENVFTVKNLKHCEDNSNSFFASLLKYKDMNHKETKAQFETLSKCVEVANALPEEEKVIHPAVKLIQYYLPRVFTSDLPRERTIIADTLAYLMPKIFDPEPDDEGDD